MGDVNLTGQEQKAAQVLSKLQDLYDQADLRVEVWQRMTYEQRKAWLDKAIKDNEDPIIQIAWQLFEYTHTNFFGDGGYGFYKEGL